MNRNLKAENPAIAKLFRNSKMQVPKPMGKTSISRAIRAIMRPFYENKKTMNALYKKNWGALNKVFSRGHVSSAQELLLIQDIVESTRAYIKNAWIVTMHLVELDPQKNPQVAERIMKLRGDIESAELFRNYCNERSDFIKKETQKSTKT